MDNDIFVSQLERNLSTKLDKENTNIVILSVIEMLNEYSVEKRKIRDNEPYEVSNQKLIERYKEYLFSGNKSVRTIDSYVLCMKRFERTVQKSFIDVTSNDVRQHIGNLKKRNLSSNYLSSERSYLQSFYEFLIKDKEIDENPVYRVQKVKKEKKERKIFTDVEIERLRTHCGNTKKRAIIEVLLTSGLRVEELTNLKISDIDPSSLMVTVRDGKGGKDRVTFISPVAYKYVLDYISNRKCETEYVFTPKLSGTTRITTSAIEKICRSIGKDAGVDKCHPHKFRRTFATNMSKRGMPIQELQELLGHERIDTTKIYVKINTTQLKSSYEKYIN